MWKSMQNETFTVASVADCATVIRSELTDDYLWRETDVGCKILLLLQEIHKFNISYIEGSQKFLDYTERKGIFYEFGKPIDIYAKPRTLWSPMLNATPISPIFVWKFGFTLRRPEPPMQHFYSLPFSEPVWHSLMLMFLLASVLFYILNRAEQWLSGQNLKCLFWQELLIVIGVCCQHYVPLNPMELTSRRIAFVSFFLFCYLIYAYYSSTLLSDLVHDRNNEMDLETLADSSYGHVVLDSVAVIIKVLVEQLYRKNNSLTPQHLSFIKKKLTNVRVVNVTTGLAEVKECNTALLSDYVSLYTTMKKTYTKTELCEIIKVHLFSHVLKYFFTSNQFKYIEEFKMSTLWAKEVGVLQRLLQTYTVPPVMHGQCASSNFQANIGHVAKPIVMLACSYILCVFILLGEIVHYKRHEVWPYVE